MPLMCSCDPLALDTRLFREAVLRNDLAACETMLVTEVCDCVEYYEVRASLCRGKERFGGFVIGLDVFWEMCEPTRLADSFLIQRGISGCTSEWRTFAPDRVISGCVT